jgi:hypothetical protein
VLLPDNCYRLNPAAIAAHAEFCVGFLRDAGLTDADILATYINPNPHADHLFELGQVAERGYVAAPAAAVKAEMRRLVVN